MGYNSTIQFGELTLSIDSLVPKKVSGTAKQVIGKKLIIKEIPGRVIQDWSISIKGKFIDANRHTDRTILEGYDDLTSHTFTDGIHDGNYFIIDLSFADDKDNPTTYDFDLVLIQEQ